LVRSDLNAYGNAPYTTQDECRPSQVGMNSGFCEQMAQLEHRQKTELCFGLQKWL
jgi:hypothetical protein